MVERVEKVEGVERVERVERVLKNVKQELLVVLKSVVRYCVMVQKSV